MLLVISGCSTDVIKDIVATSWSDNSKKIAFIERRYEKRYNVTDSSIENIEYRLGVIDRNNEFRQYITDYFKGSKSSNLFTTQEIHYKSNAGYFLVRVGDSGSYIKNNVIFTDEYEYFLYDIEGNIIHKITKAPQQYCDNFNTIIPSIRAMPSPSGNLIAKVETTINCELEITILNYNHNFEALNIQRIDGIAIAGLFWVDEKNLLINACLWVGCTDNWILIRPEEEESVSIDNELFLSLCLAGKIVSSNINSSDEGIEWSDPGRNLEIVKIGDYSGTELNWRTNSDTRKPNDPEDCINIENV